MKTNRSIKTFHTALLLAAAQSGTQAASLLADGNFDNLPVGTAPNVGVPAGHWFWPADYLLGEGEAAASQFSIAPHRPAASAMPCEFHSPPQRAVACTPTYPTFWPDR